MNNNNKVLQALYKNRLSRSFIHQILNSRAEELGQRIIPYLSRDELILDIGPASCTVTEWLIGKSLKVFPLDIQNYSIVSAISPTLYDGDQMPFKDDQFDTSLLLFVLHHSPDPEKLLREVKRVSKKVLILEDIITSSPHKHLTAVIDGLLNLEPFDQPHSNKSDEEWRSLYIKMDFELISREYWNSGVIKHGLYQLEKKTGI